MPKTYKFSDRITADNAAGNILTTVNNAQDMHAGFANINGPAHQGYTVYTQQALTKEDILAEALPYRQLVGYFEYDGTKEPATITKYDISEIKPESIQAQVIENYVEMRDNQDLIPVAKRTLFDRTFQNSINEFMGEEIHQR